MQKCWPILLLLGIESSKNPGNMVQLSEWSFELNFHILSTLMLTHNQKLRKKKISQQLLLIFSHTVQTPFGLQISISYISSSPCHNFTFQVVGQKYDPKIGLEIFYPKYRLYGGGCNLRLLNKFQKRSLITILICSFSSGVYEKIFA